MSCCENSPEPPLVGEGGLRWPAAAATDPLMALDGLMAVVEALCPAWPSRAAPTYSAGLLL